MKKDHYVQAPSPAATEFHHDEEKKAVVTTQVEEGSWKALDSMEVGNGLGRWDRKEGTEVLGAHGNKLAGDARMHTRRHSGNRGNTCSQEKFSQFSERETDARRYSQSTHRQGIVLVISGGGMPCPPKGAGGAYSEVRGGGGM